jgi:hypothetical protein
LAIAYLIGKAVSAGAQQLNYRSSRYQADRSIALDGVVPELLGRRFVPRQRFHHSRPNHRHANPDIGQFAEALLVVKLRWLELAPWVGITYLSK